MKPEEPQTKTTAMASARGDLRLLKQNSSATVAELKAFLRELRGKSPQEMLGIVASSQLFRAIGVSTALVFAGIVIFTAVPFALGGKEKQAPPIDAPTAAGPAPAPSPAPAPAPAPAPVPASPDPAQPAAPELAPLGVEETKTAAPNQNPLENDNDNFLDDLE